MELSELQMSITALFLLTAVAIVVLCNVLRNRTQRREKRPQIRVVEPAWRAFELPAQQATGSLAAEIAALASLGMQEENSAWRKIGPDIETSAAHTEPVQPCKALQPQPVTIDEFLFDLLVSGRSTKDFANLPNLAPRPSLETQFEVIHAPHVPSEVAPPHGMIDAATLGKVVAIGKPFTGVAVAICVNEDESGRRSEGQLKWVCTYLAGLLSQHEFASRTGREEFLIVCPGVRGAEAQRRLNDISERLWDFQLRGIGTYSILFSWGGVEVQNQPLADAIASATERMRLTKRVRNPIYLDSVNVRRKIV